MFWIFGLEAYGISVYWPGIKPTPPALEGEVLTTALPEKSLKNILLNLLNWKSVGGKLFPFFFTWKYLYFIPTLKNISH